VVSVTRGGRGRPEVTSPFDFSTPLLYKWSVDIFCHLFPFKSYSTFSFWLEIAIGAEILGFLGDSRPLNACAHQRDPEKAPTCVKPRRLSHHACLCDARFDRYAIAKKKKKKNIKKKSQSRYISRMRGAPLSNRLQWKFAHLLRSPT
jgi:hypothetical protein